MRRMTTTVVVLLVCQTSSTAFAEPPADTNIQGGFRFGAELDPQGLPELSKEPPAKLRIGVSLNWSFVMRWDRSADVSAPSTPSDAGLTAEEQALIDFTNVERKKVNLPPLKADPTLMAVARKHTLHMARLNQISHELEGRSFSVRMKESGYKAMAAGENCAEGAESPQEAVSDWLQSPGHKANMLSAKYTHLGVGLAESKSGRRYYTQVFAKPLEKLPTDE